MWNGNLKLIDTWTVPSNRGPVICRRWRDYGPLLKAMKDPYFKRPRGRK